MNAITVNSLTKFYAKRQALFEVSFNIPEGDFFGFLGPNGAGKTTTIHAITGLVNFQGGDVKVFGHDVVHDYRESRALIGFVPQEFNFDPYLTAEEILRFEGGYFGMPKREAESRALQLLEEFDLLAHRKLDYRKLSGGMKRRLLIARGLMHRPRILVLDEPTAGVDLELRLKMWELLKKLNQSGITIFLTTHYIEEAERLCKRIGVIHKGHIIALDTTERLIEKLGRQIVAITLDRSINEVPDEFKQLGADLARNGNVLRVGQNDHTLDELLQKIHARGLKVVRIDTEKTNLEDIFLELTKSEKQPAAA